MPYTDELKEMMKAVERTRPERIARKRKGVDFPPMTLQEREDILRRYHPDFKDGTKRPISIGPSKGYEIPHELVDLFESRSRVNPDIVDLSHPEYETDVLVIGGGGAGTSAALLAQEHGAKVIISSKLRHGDANTMMAEGGIQASSKLEKDSPVFHYLDSLGGGRFKNDPDLVYTLVTEAPKVVEWLEHLGVLFFKYPEGRFQTMPGAGYARSRLIFAGDITGTEIMRTIRDEARNRSEDITVLEFAPAVELILNQYGQCAGAVLYNLETEEYFVVKAKAVVMATGGLGRLHIQGFMTTNHYGATADGLVLGYRVGVKLRFMHCIQYHPTGTIYPEQLEGSLITEKFRASGASVVNRDGEQFVYEREPRDVESAAYIRECLERGKGVPTPTGKLGVWLDSPMLEQMNGTGWVAEQFPGKMKQFGRHGINLATEPMLVYPTLHYQNGGLEYKSDGSTVVPGLFVGGEVGGGVHGENRLMGNSLLDILVFGRLAGVSAAEFAKSGYKDGKLTLDHVRAYHKELDAAGIKTNRIAPMVLPDYTDPEVRRRQLTSSYAGTLR